MDPPSHDVQRVGHALREQTREPAEEQPRGHRHLRRARGVGIPRLTRRGRRRRGSFPPRTLQRLKRRERYPGVRDDTHERRSETAVETADPLRAQYRGHHAHVRLGGVRVGSHHATRRVPGSHEIERVSERRRRRARRGAGDEPHRDALPA